MPKFVIYTASVEESHNRTRYRKAQHYLFPDINEEMYEKDVDPFIWGLQTVEWFNETRRVGERKRVYLGCTIISNSISGMSHEWEKSCLVTQISKGTSYDTMKCKNCGITGKRYGLGQSGTIIDPKYKKEKYKYCK